MTNDDTEMGTFANHEMFDEQGERIGMITDVVSDAATLEPRWLVVDPGVLRAPHYVPAAGARQTEDGRIVVPYAPDVVKQSPKVHGDHVMSAAFEDELAQHYGLSS